MNIIKFEERLNEIMDDIQYQIFFGTRSIYFTKKRDIFKNEIILEPFKFKVGDWCHNDTNFTIWVLKKKEIDDKMRTDKGIMTKDYQEMIDDCHRIMKKMNDSGFLLIKKKLEDIEIDIYDADGAESINTQIMAKLTFPVRIYNNY